MKNVFGGIMHVHFPVRGTDCENRKACASVQFLSEGGGGFIPKHFVARLMWKLVVE